VSFEKCGITTDLTDTEIAAIIRQLAGPGGVAENIQTIAVDATCMLSSRHAGPCAGYVADAVDDLGDPASTATAWLRWSGDERVIDWLVGCVSQSCFLFRGHAGGCNPLDPLAWRS
jgi:hypothetical protein